MNTLKQFAQRSHLPAKLVRAVIRQVGGFDSFKELADDVTNYGANGGFSGFVYYTDTVAFTTKNKAEILESLKTLAADMGETFSACLCGFGAFKGKTESDVLDGLYNHRSDMRQTVYNVLAWYALEEVARSYVDLTEGY